MSITKEHFGKTNHGEDVYRYTLSNKNGIVVRILTYGGCIQSVQVPGSNGVHEDITTGYDSVAEYENNPAYFGAVIGRWANRIYAGKFEVDGTQYSVAVNNGACHLHGGIVGWSKKIWDATIEERKLVLSYVSPDGDEGFPGTVSASVTYELTDDNELAIQYSATTDKATPINLSNHAYWNLAGHKAPNVYDHTIQLNAKTYTPKNEDNVPSGEIADVSGTVYDLQEKTNLGECIPKIAADNVGFDINYCVDGTGEKKLAARVEHAGSGRVLEVYTNMPGIQLYTANYLEGEPGKDGAVYGKHSCLALETQNYPDAINKPDFPNSVLRPGETYDHKTWLKFGKA